MQFGMSEPQSKGEESKGSSKSYEFGHNRLIKFSQYCRGMPDSPSEEQPKPIKVPDVMLRVRLLMKLLDKTLEELFSIIKIQRDGRPISDLLSDLYRGYVDEKANKIEEKENEKNVDQLIEVFQEKYPPEVSYENPDYSGLQPLNSKEYIQEKIENTDRSNPAITPPERYENCSTPPPDIIERLDITPPEIVEEAAMTPAAQIPPDIVREDMSPPKEDGEAQIIEEAFVAPIQTYPNFLSIQLDSSDDEVPQTPPEIRKDRQQYKAFKRQRKEEKQKKRYAKLNIPYDEEFERKLRIQRKEFNRKLSEDISMDRDKSYFSVISRDEWLWTGSKYVRMAKSNNKQKPQNYENYGCGISIGNPLFRDKEYRKRMDEIYNQKGYVPFSQRRGYVKSQYLYQQLMDEPKRQKELERIRAQMGEDDEQICQSEAVKEKQQFFEVQNNNQNEIQINNGNSQKEIEVQNKSEFEIASPANIQSQIGPLSEQIEIYKESSLRVDVLYMSQQQLNCQEDKKSIPQGKLSEFDAQPKKRVRKKKDKAQKENDENQKKEEKEKKVKVLNILTKAQNILEAEKEACRKVRS